MSIRGIFQCYQRLLNKHPYIVQAVQTGTLMATGDIISQTQIEKKSLTSMDYKRTLKFASIGFFVTGPASRAWYGILNTYVGTSGKTVAIKKVFLDQVIFAPTFLFFVLVAVGTMQGKSFDTIKTDLDANYFDVIITNYYIWPMVQLLNFYYIPLHYQVLTVQCVGLVWNTYLSWKANRDSKQTETPSE